MTNSIEIIADLQDLVLQGFDDWKSLGNVSVSNYDNLLLFNYTATAQFEAQWNFFERISRGLILDSKTGEVIARPFSKFFNWGEGGRYTNASIKLVTEKVDGSLGILYRHNGRFGIATRGSFESDQAIWATRYLEKNYNLSGLPHYLTLLFEIIYPDNRIVVNYHGLEGLVLLAARNRITGEYISWSGTHQIAKTFGFFLLPTVYEFDDPDDLVNQCKTLPPNTEGYVVEFTDGQRFKFKGEQYVRLHKIISGLNFKKVLDCMANNTLDELRAIVPDEFMPDVNTWVDEIQDTVNDTIEQIQAAFDQAPKSTRKEFALWVMKNHKDLSPYLFAMFDDKPIEGMIYKLAFNDNQD